MHSSLPQEKHWSIIFHVTLVICEIKSWIFDERISKQLLVRVVAARGVQLEPQLRCQVRPGSIDAWLDELMEQEKKKRKKMGEKGTDLHYIYY